MNKSISQIRGYILAGGKSSRMGEDKGLKQFNGKALVQTVIDQMQLALDEVVIVSNNLDYKQFGLVVIEDVIKNIGPAGGIYTALQHSISEKIFVVSCDMPFITCDAISFLMKRSKDKEITLPEKDGKLEPLFGVYSKAVLYQWKNLIDKDCIKIQQMVKNFDLKIINVTGKSIFPDHLFKNINTPGEFTNALNSLRQ